MSDSDHCDSKVHPCVVVVATKSNSSVLEEEMFQSQLAPFQKKHPGEFDVLPSWLDALYPNSSQ